MRLGIALFVLGAIFLLHSLDLLTNTHISLIFPTLLIIAGISLMIRPVYQCGRCMRSSWRNNPRCKECARQWCGKPECAGCEVCDDVPGSVKATPAGVSAAQ